VKDVNRLRKWGTQACVLSRTGRGKTTYVKQKKEDGKQGSQFFLPEKPRGQIKSRGAC